MRQLARGVLAALVLVLVACGNDGETDAASTASAVPDTALAASSEATTPPDDIVATAAGSFTIAVTSPEGIDAPGLDAAVSVLAGRPDTNVSVTAPAADVRADPEGHASTALVPVEASTMTGHRGAVVNGSMLDTIEAVNADGTARPDLLVIGLTDDAGPESATMTGARLAAERGIPVLIIVVGGDDPDLAGAGVLLSMVADYDLDAVIAAPAVHVLTVPSCANGLIRGPVLVDPAPEGLPPVTVDCASPDTGPFADEAGAWAAGHATLAVRR